MRSIRKLFIGTASVQLASKGANLLLSIILARMLSVEQYGLYSFSLSLIAVAILPIVAGLPTLIIREISQYLSDDKNSEIYGIINWSRFYVILTSLLIMFFFEIYTIYSSNKLLSSVLVIAAFILPLRSIVIHQSSIINSFRNPIVSQIHQVFLVPFISIIGVGCYYILSDNFLTKHVMIIVVFSWSICLVSSVLFTNKIIRNNLIKEQASYSVKNWFLTLVPFSLMTIIGTLNTELAGLYIGAYFNTELVAYFRVGMQAVTVIAIGLTSMNLVIMPNIARLYKNNNIEETQKLLTKSVRINSIISIPILLFFIFEGDVFINILFGEQYSKSHSILIVLCVGQIFNVTMGSVGAVLSMTNNEKKMLPILISALILNLFLLMFLTPIYGIDGAAVATSISVIVLNVFMALKVKRVTGLITWIR